VESSKRGPHTIALFLGVAAVAGRRSPRFLSRRNKPDHDVVAKVSHTAPATFQQACGGVKGERGSTVLALTKVAKIDYDLRLC